jgi:hypothetical protein
MNNFWFVARKLFNCTFKKFKSLALDAPEGLHLAAIGAELLAWSLDDQCSATFCAIRLHEEPTLLVLLLCIITHYGRECNRVEIRYAHLFFDTATILPVSSQFS